MGLYPKMVLHPYLDYNPRSPRGFVHDLTSSSWSRRTPSAEERQLPQQPRPRQEEEEEEEQQQQQNANQPAAEEEGSQGLTGIWRWKAFDQSNAVRVLFAGTSLLLVIPWVVAVAFLAYQRKYFVITFVSVLFLASLAAVSFRMIIATRNANNRQRQMQFRASFRSFLQQIQIKERASNPPPSYESVVATPPPYDQLYNTTAPTTSNENTSHNPLDPEDSAAAAANNSPDDTVDLPSIGCSHERGPNSSCKYCLVLEKLDPATVEAHPPPSYEEVILSNNSSCKLTTHQDTRE